MIAALIAAGLLAPSPSPASSPLIVDRYRADRMAPAAPRRRRRHRPKAAATKQIAAKPFPIARIEFPLATPPEAVVAATRPFLGRLADEATLTALATAMSDAYDRTPIALHTIAIDGDDLLGGVVRVRVVEGYVERVNLSGSRNAAVAARVHVLARAMLAEHPLRRATMERTLALLGTIPGATVESSFSTGDKPGGVILDVKVAAQRWSVSASADNRAPALLGHEEARVTLDIYGLLRGGDDTSFGLTTAPEPTRYRYFTIAHSTPIGSDGLVGTANVGWLRTRAGRDQLLGHAVNWGVGASYPIRLSSNRSLSAGLSFDGLDSDNALLAEQIVTERSRAVRGTLSFTRSDDRHGLSASLVLSHGLDVLAACTNDLSGTPRFMKVNGTVRLERVIGTRFVARVSGSAQYAGTALPTAETFAVGGADYGRAFDTGIISGDRGGAASGELAWVPPWKTPAHGELYVFADGARVRLLQRDLLPARSDALASTGIGLRGTIGSASIDLSAARALVRPDAVEQRQGDTRVALSVGVVFGG